MTEHPLFADLKAHLDELQALEPDPVQEEVVTEDRMLDPQVARGIPCFDGNRGMPGGATLPGTRPGDTLANLEKINRDVARSLKGDERISSTGITRPRKVNRNGPDLAHFPVRPKP